jgi:hypothetical protein
MWNSEAFYRRETRPTEDEEGSGHECDCPDCTAPLLYCEWCASAFPATDPASPCCSLTCSRDWQAWRDRRVQPPEPLADGDVLPF